ncbi:MAG: hypothetical protein JW995_07440 [Melioribacteraceae bacterium]|nr:hypothetical protein [Melioribacteraceae bacterium]
MIYYYFKEAFNTFRKTKLFSFVAIISLSLSVLFLTGSLLLMFASSEINEKLKKKIEANLFLNDSVSVTSVNKIKAEISESEYIADINYISKEEAEKKFIAETGRDFRSLLEANPLPQLLVIKFNKNINEQELETIINELKVIKGVDDVVIDYNLAITLLNYLNSAKVIIYLSGFLMLIISVYLIYSSSKMYILHNKIHYKTMKLVGAKLSTLRIPLFIRGVILGTASGVLSVIIFNTILITVRQISVHFEFVSLTYFINFILIILGIILGPIGTGIFSKKLSLKIDTSNQ